MRGRWLKMVCPNGLLAPAGLSKWSVLLVCPAGLSKWSVQMVFWLKMVCPSCAGAPFNPVHVCGCLCVCARG